MKLSLAVPLRLAAAFLALMTFAVLGVGATAALAKSSQVTSHHRSKTHAVRCSAIRGHSSRSARRRRECIRREAALRRRTVKKKTTHTTAKPVATTTSPIAVAARKHSVSITLTGKPAAPTTATSAQFTWSTSAGIRSTTCSHDGSLYVSCSSGVTYNNLSARAHQFSVRVSDGQTTSVAYDDWRISALPAAVPTPTPPPLPNPSPVANTFGQGMFGIASGSTMQNESTTPALMDQDLGLDRTLGAKWIRIDINWAQIQEQGPTSYYWAQIDAAVEQAEADGMSVLGTIVYTPSWARPVGTPATNAPAPSTYATFAAAAAAHYSALGVHAFEIWNEPNITGTWTPAPSPAAYTAVLRAAYVAIKGVDPTATVLTGGLAPAATDGRDYTPVDFLAGIYANGGQGYFDAVGNHPYDWPAYPGDADTWSAWYQMYGTSTSLRSLMIAHGDSAKLIWGTEFGAPTNGPAGSFVTPAVQAAMITRAFQLWSTYSWAGPLFIYDARDQGTDTSTRENFFGLFNHDFSPKPSAAAYETAVAAL